MPIERHKGMFASRGKSQLFDEVSEVYDRLLPRRENSRPAVLDDCDFGAPRRVRDNTMVYRQVLLHRSILLFEGSLAAAADENAYSMALSIRGHFETTAALGYVHYRLASVQMKYISAAEFDEGLSAQMLGSKDEGLPQAPDPKHVLTMLEYADKTVNKHVVSGANKPLPLLTDPYNWLCEFCHPNYYSNAIAIDVDKSVPEFRFRFEQPMRDTEFGLLGHLMLSAPLFVEIFDLIPKMLPDHSNRDAPSN